LHEFGGFGFETGRKEVISGLWLVVSSNVTQRTEKAT